MAAAPARTNVSSRIAGQPERIRVIIPGAHEKRARVLFGHKESRAALGVAARVHGRVCVERGGVMVKLVVEF